MRLRSEPRLAGRPEGLWLGRGTELALLAGRLGCVDGSSTGQRWGLLERLLELGRRRRYVLNRLLGSLGHALVNT